MSDKANDAVNDIIFAAGGFVKSRQSDTSLTGHIVSIIPIQEALENLICPDEPDEPDDGPPF